MKRNSKETAKTINASEKATSGRGKNIGIIFLLAVLFAIPANALAGGRGRMMVDQREPFVEKERFVLDFGDNYYRGRHGMGTTFYLKKALKAQYPWVNISDYRLRKVTLVAKSQYGRGRAQLRVGPEVTDFYRVDGRPGSFHDGRKRTFDKVKINSPFRDSWGPWQLNLKGIFKVRKVVVVAEKRIDNHYGWKHRDKPRQQYRHLLPGDARLHLNVRW